MQEPSGASLSAESPDRARVPGDRRWVLQRFGAVAAITFVLDQLTKVWALGALVDGRTVDLVGDLLRLRLLRNSGAAFSLGNSMTWLMTVVAVVVTVGIVVLVRRVGSTWWAIALGMVFGGSLGNLVDRFFREPGPGRGHVVDFIDYLGLFVGNVADIGIVLGALGAVWLSLRDVSMDGRHPRHVGETHLSGTKGEEQHG